MALLFILKLMARSIGARSNDIRLIRKDDPRGQLLMQAQRVNKAPEERNSKRNTEPTYKQQTQFE
jgi:hypothetical protein